MENQKTLEKIVFGEMKVKVGDVGAIIHALNSSYAIHRFKHYEKTFFKNNIENIIG
jgi:hypothetical protein